MEQEHTAMEQEQQQQPVRKNNYIVEKIIGFELCVFFGFCSYFASNAMEEKLRSRLFVNDLCFSCAALAHLLCYDVVDPCNKRFSDRSLIKKIALQVAWICFWIERLLICLAFRNFFYVANPGRNLKLAAAAAALAGFCAACNLVYMSFGCLQWLPVNYSIPKSISNILRNLKMGWIQIWYIEEKDEEDEWYQDGENEEDEWGIDEDEEDEWYQDEEDEEEDEWGIEEDEGGEWYQDEGDEGGNEEDEEDEWDVVSNKEKGHQKCTLELRKVKKDMEEWQRRYESLAAELVEARACVEVYRQLLHDA